MDVVRRPLQGVLNILRFNWHFFGAATAVVLTLVVASAWLPEAGRRLAVGAAGLLLGVTMISLVVSWYVYDLSGLYRLDWLPRKDLDAAPGARMANVHAGFDETTGLLRARYPDAEWTVMDFYDPARHTEISIRRARRAHPPSPDDLRVDTANLEIADASLDAVFAILAAHEIRDADERARFFAELRRVLRPGGRVVVVEHVRDWRNFLAYTAGAFHFLSRRAWLAAFERGGLRRAAILKPNPFITCFVLEKSADPP